jgi:hypothetical protein
MSTRPRVAAGASDLCARASWNIVQGGVGDDLLEPTPFVLTRHSWPAVRRGTRITSESLTCTHALFVQRVI